MLQNKALESKLMNSGIVAAGLLTAAIAGYKSADSVEAGKIGIVTSFGQIERTVESGLAFHWPWQKVTKLSLQSQTIDIPLEVYSKDSQLAPQNVLSVTFSLPKDSAVKVFSEYGADYFRAVLKNPTENIFREAFGMRTADHIIADREALNSEVSTRLQKEFLTRSINFERLGISIKFNEAFNHSAEESAIARTKVNTAKQDLERKKVEADQLEVEAKGKAASSVELKIAEAKGITELGNAQANVLQRKAELLRQNPGIVNLMAAERWDGKLPTTMIPGQSTPMIQLDLTKESIK